MALPQSVIYIFRSCLVIALMLIIYLASIKLNYPVLVSINDKLGHILAFVMLAFLADFSFPASRFTLQKILLLLSYGVAIEVMQYFIPSRMFSLLDMLADGIGILLYILLIPLLKQIPFFKLRWAEKPQLVNSM